MPAAQRHLPSLLLFLPSLLLISCLDGAVRAAEGGGLPSSPGDNGVIAAVGEQSSANPTAVERLLSPSALTAGDCKPAVVSYC